MCFERWAYFQNLVENIVPLSIQAHGVFKNAFRTCLDPLFPKPQYYVISSLILSHSVFGGNLAFYPIIVDISKLGESFLPHYLFNAIIRKFQRIPLSQIPLAINCFIVYEVFLYRFSHLILTSTYRHYYSHFIGK